MRQFAALGPDYRLHGAVRGMRQMPPNAAKMLVNFFLTTGSGSLALALWLWLSVL